MTKNLIRAAIAAALCTTALLANAANVTLTGWAYGSAGNVAVTSPVYSGAAGGFTGSLSGAGSFDTTSFQTYCVELTEAFAFSKYPMTGYTIVAGNSYFGDATAQRIDKLFTYLDSHPTAVDSAAESTSLQLAIWNLIYDNDSSLAGGSFKDTTKYADYASTLLSESDKVTTSDYAVFALQRSGSQDFLLLSHIPEPASILLVGTALFGMGVASRRRKPGQA